MYRQDIQKLRDLPIEEVAQRLGMHPERHKCLCPFHDDHHASLTFSARRNTCRCYVCMNKPLGTIDLVMKAMNTDFLDACRWLASTANFYIPERQAPTPTAGKERAFDAERCARFFEHPYLNKDAQAFLFCERNLDPAIMAWLRVTTWVDKEGRSWLEIPYYDTDYKLAGMQLRNLTHFGPRFLFRKGAKCTIYNMQVMNLIKEEGETVYIAEGCSDCWALLSSGHKAIAIPSATLLTEQDKAWLRDVTERMRIVWRMYPDNDVPGERLFLQLKEVLPSLLHCRIPEGCKDYAEYYNKFRGMAVSPILVHGMQRRIQEETKRLTRR